MRWRILKTRKYRRIGTLGSRQSKHRPKSLLSGEETKPCKYYFSKAGSKTSRLVDLFLPRTNPNQHGTPASSTSTCPAISHLRHRSRPHPLRVLALHNRSTWPPLPTSKTASPSSPSSLVSPTTPTPKQHPLQTTSRSLT